MNSTFGASRHMGKRFAIRMADGLLSLLLGSLLSSFALGAAARIDQIRGNVDKRNPGALDWRIVTPGEKIEEGSILRTGPNSEADVVTEQGHHFVLRAETTFEFSALQPDET